MTRGAAVLGMLVCAAAPAMGQLCGFPTVGNCCAPNGTPFCNNLICCNTVCAQDPFCCNTEWDQMCANQANEICVVCDACCVDNGTPGCNENVCESTICSIDPFCCDVEWDGLCADQAAEFCDVCGGADCGASDAGGCYEPNGTPACNDGGCCAEVCGADPFCCDVEWDGVCVNQAFEICGNCGGADAGGCVEANGTPGCDDADCCEAVCTIDPFCCNIEWDGLCAGEAIETCICGEAGGDCYEPNGAPGCNNADCCAEVCGADPFCCDIEWDGLCVDEALELCGNCGGGGAGGCFEANGTPGCDDADCCEAVCTIDPFCCNFEWDGLCAGEALQSCAGCGEPSAGNCCEPNGTPGCNDLDCCEIICAADPFCCEIEWDGICTDAAQAECNVCDAGACCVGLSCSVLTPLACAIQGGEYQGDGVPCGPVTCGVIVLTGACCFPDGSCAVTLINVCASQGGEFQGVGLSCAEVDCDCNADLDGDGDTDSADLNLLLGDFGCGASNCCTPNGTPGCNNPACEAAVCAIDPFCCDIDWDGICAGEAEDLCGVCGDCEGDVNGDGDTDSGDLNALLADFGCGA